MQNCNEMTRRGGNPFDDFLASVNAIIKSAPEILQDAAMGVAATAVVQVVVSGWIPVWLVTLLIAGYTVLSLLREGLAVWKSRTFRILGIALLTLLVDLYFTFAVGRMPALDSSESIISS